MEKEPSNYRFRPLVKVPPNAFLWLSYITWETSELWRCTCTTYNEPLAKRCKCKNFEQIPFRRIYYSLEFNESFRSTQDGNFSSDNHHAFLHNPLQNHSLRQNHKLFKLIFSCKGENINRTAIAEMWFHHASSNNSFIICCQYQLTFLAWLLSIDRKKNQRRPSKLSVMYGGICSLQKLRRKAVCRICFARRRISGSYEPKSRI